MRRPVLAVLLLAGSLGCASSSLEQQSVPVITQPSGASATAGTQAIKTPGSLLVPVGAREMEIRIELEGYEPATVRLTQPGPSAFADCFKHATSEPQRGSGGSNPSGASVEAAIGSAVLRAATDCARQTDLLEPGFVFLKLEPVWNDLPPLPLGRSFARQ